MIPLRPLSIGVAALALVVVIPAVGLGNDDAPASVSAAEELRAGGEAAARQGDDEAAQAQFDRAVAILQKAKAPLALARTYLSRGTWHLGGGRMDRARPDLEAALAGFEAADDADGVRVAATNLGLLLEDLGELEEALTAHERALRSAERGEDTAHVAAALLGRASVLHRLGRDAEALPALERALRLAGETGDVLLQAQARTERATVHLDRGNTARALHEFRLARTGFEQVGAAHLVARTMGNIGATHERRGEFGPALRSYETALAQFLAAGDAEAAATALLNLGTLHLGLGQHDRAEARLDDAGRRFEARGDRGGRVRVLLARAAIAAARGEAAARSEHLAEAQTLARDVEDPRLQASARIEQAGAALATGDIDAARAHLQEARRAYDAAEDPVGAAGCMQQLAEIALGRGALQEAEDLSSQVLASGREADARALVVQSLACLAEVEAAREQPQRALELAREAVETLPFLLHGLDDVRSARAGARWRRAFDVGLRASLALSDTERALWFVEAGRAAQLRASLGGRARLRRAVLPARLLTAEAEARADARAALDAYRRLQRRRARPSALSVARRTLQAARQRMRDLAARIQVEAKASQDTLYPRPLDARAIQDTLAPGEALVLYVEGDALRALVITTTTVRVVHVGTIARATAVARDITISSDEALPMQALGMARAVLRDPLDLPEQITRVLVSPSAGLARVSFALVFPRREVAYTASATTHALLHPQRALQGIDVLGLGDANYAGHPDQLVALPGSRTEVTAVADVHLLSERASETALRETLLARRRWRAIHLACHGLIDDEDPGLSRLALSRDAVHDGSLTVSEVMALDAPADLVTLSACDSGLGEVTRGEGVLGFTRAFMLAGTPRVIVSLWRVDDEATSYLMRELYARWRPPGGAAGLPLAKALREAQTAVRRRPGWQHPYYWAAWTLWGLPDAAPDTRVVLSVEQAAERAKAAAGTQDAAAFAELATQADPDPWRVVDRLLRDGAPEEARALAAAVAPSERKALSAYARRDPITDASWAMRLAAARAAQRAGETEKAATILAGTGAAENDVLGLEVRSARALLEADASDHAHRERGAEALLAIARACDRLGWRAEAGRALRRAGPTASSIGRHDLAVQAWQALRILEAAQGARIAAAQATSDLAVALQRLGDLSGARKVASEALAVLVTSDDQTAIARVRSNLAGIAFAQGDAERAAKHAEQAQADARRAGATEVEAAALANLGLALEATGEIERASAVQEQALDLLDRVRDTRSAAVIHDNLANLLADGGWQARAVHHHERAIALHVERGDARGEATARGNAAMTLLAEARWADAAVHQREASEIWAVLGDKARRRHGLLAEALIETTRFRPRAAIRLYRDVARFAEADGADTTAREASGRAEGVARAAGLSLDPDTEPDPLRVRARAEARTALQHLRTVARSGDAATAIAAWVAWARARHLAAHGGDVRAAAALLSDEAGATFLEARARLAHLSAPSRETREPGAIEVARERLVDARLKLGARGWLFDAPIPPLASIRGRVPAGTIWLLPFPGEKEPWSVRISSAVVRVGPGLDTASNAPRTWFATADRPPLRPGDRLATPRLLFGSAAPASGEGTWMLTGGRIALPRTIQGSLGTSLSMPAPMQGPRVRPATSVIGSEPQGVASRWRCVVIDAPLYLSHDALDRCALVIAAGADGLLTPCALAEKPLPADVWLFPHVGGGAKPACVAAFVEACARAGARHVVLAAGATADARAAMPRRLQRALASHQDLRDALREAGVDAASGWSVWTIDP